MKYYFLNFLFTDGNEEYCINRVAIGNNIIDNLDKLLIKLSKVWLRQLKKNTNNIKIIEKSFLEISKEVYEKLNNK